MGPGAIPLGFAQLSGSSSANAGCVMQIAAMAAIFLNLVIGISEFDKQSLGRSAPSAQISSLLGLDKVNLCK